MADTNITFDSATGLAAPDTADIVAAIQDDWKNALGQDLNTDAASPQGQLITSQAALVATKNNEILYLANQFNPFTSEGIWQDALAAIYFLQRKVATPTVVTCLCKGLNGTAIPSGALVESTEGVRFYASGALTIPSNGEIEGTFICESDENLAVAANTVTKIITVVAGWDTVNNNEDGVTGTTLESQGAFEKRRYESVAINSHGSVASLYSALSSIESVIDCVVLENALDAEITTWGVDIDAHSIACCIYGGTDADIAQTLYNKKAMGTGTSGTSEISHIATDYFDAAYTYNIVRPSETPIYIKITIRETADMSSTYEDDIKNALISDFIGENTDSNNTRVRMASTLYASRFSIAVIQTAGISDLISITIKKDGNSYVNYVDIMADEEPTLSADDITIIVED